MTGLHGTLEVHHIHDMHVNHSKQMKDTHPQANLIQVRKAKVKVNFI